MTLRQPKAVTIVRQQVRDLLERSPAYGKLPLEKQRQIARDMVKISGYLSEPQDLTRKVDFPGFVSGIINGVFDSIVDSSIKQMEAYAELVRDVAKTVDRFTEDNTAESGERDHLSDEWKKRRKKVSSMISKDIHRIVK